MRRNIFKGEFENLCHKLDLSRECKFKLINALFSGTQYDLKEYYDLKEEYYNYNTLLNKFSSIIGQVEDTKVIKDVFTISSDLNIIPEELLKEIKLKNVAVFVGAGLSKVVSDKYPLWDELANKSIKYLFNNRKINFFEKERLIREISDPKQKLSIFEKYIGGKTDEEYKKFLNQNFNFKNESQPSKENPYQILCSENFNFIKVTSNVDLEFVNAFSAMQQKRFGISNQFANEKPSRVEQLNKRKDFIEYDINQDRFRYDKIYMIHGSIEKYERTVFTIDDYIREYFDNDGGISKFLIKLFSELTVLFIGYGLSEFPILEKIISKAGKKRHYVLLPTFISEINYFQKQASYLDKLNITAIPYYIDNDGFDRIINLLTNWERIVTRNSLYSIGIIDKFLKESNGNR